MRSSGGAAHGRRPRVKPPPKFDSCPLLHPRGLSSDIKDAASRRVVRESATARFGVSRAYEPDAFADDHAPLVPLVSFRRVAIKMDSSGNQWETVTFDKRGPGGRVSGQSQKQTLMKAQRAGAVSAQAKCASHRRAARVRIRVR